MADFCSLLPPNATEFERTLEQATSRVGTVPVEIRNYWNADLIPRNLMPWLGWEWSVDSWDPDWDIKTKRNVLRDAFRYHQYKGTRQSVVDAINDLGSNIDIKEWWQYSNPKTPHTFDAFVDSVSGSGSGEFQYQLIHAIDNAKPVRSHYTLTVATNACGSLNIYGYGRVARFQRLYLQEHLTFNILLHRFVHVVWPSFWNES
ncbi:phage tail protein I [Endozoicomonas sp. 4G]|uniref:phage tail protein I n=1 Tax=Endozoicomonas sp. 4G TaxID=2872754 RepID=UPI002078DDFD|nr:phage tail protein I [Endozoicomonas sp. 4G]